MRCVSCCLPVRVRIPLLAGVCAACALCSAKVLWQDTAQDPDPAVWVVGTSMSCMGSWARLHAARGARKPGAGMHRGQRAVALPGQAAGQGRLLVAQLHAPVHGSGVVHCPNGAACLPLVHPALRPAPPAISHHSTAPGCHRRRWRNRLTPSTLCKHCCCTIAAVVRQGWFGCVDCRWWTA